MVLKNKIKDAVYQLTSFLSDNGNPHVEDLLEMSKWNRRIRNVTPLYSLFFQKDKWERLTQEKIDVNSLDNQFLYALNKLVNSNSEASLLAKELKRTYYPNGKITNHFDSDVANEMIKLLESIVRSVNLNDSLQENTKKSVEEKLKKVDFDNLIVDE